MASLYKRATPAQARVIRIVAGAVRNASHSHPELNVPDHFARSVAKRAAGTLTAGWPEVLAARSAPSDRATCQTTNKCVHDRAQSIKPFGRGSVTIAYRRSPLVDLWADIARMIYAPKKAGNHERVQALVDVLKMIAVKQRGAG